MQMPYSSYMYTIDDTYRAKLWGSFWSAYTDVPQNTQFSPVIDSIAWDIDGDGNAEMCSMRYGPTSGLFSVTLLASPAEPTASGQEFEDTFVLKGSYELSFVVSPDQKLKIRGEDTNDPERTVWFDMGVKDGHIVLQCEEEDLYFSMYQ